MKKQLVNKPEIPRTGYTAPGRGIATLDQQHLVQVSGGGWGTGPTGLFSVANLSAASRLAGGLGLLYSSYKVGYAIGTGLYNFGTRIIFRRHRR